METHNKKCLIICNPKSGKGIQEKVLRAYFGILREYGYQVDFVTTRHQNHAMSLVRHAKDDYDVVFSVGGDGTLNEVVKGNHLREKKLTICPLPNGTCNDVASMYGYGNNPIDNLKMALEGEVHDVDIGTINDTPFAYVVGMGKFMNIPYETASEEKRKQGYLAYLKSGVFEIVNKMKRYQAEVTVDGVRLDGSYSLIMVSNANHIAGIDHFYRDMSLDDGEMELLLCKSKNKRELLGSFVQFFLGQSTDNIISLKAHDVSIRLIDQPDKNWCIDGEEFKSSANEYRIRIGEKMKFLTPKLKGKKLFTKG